VNRGRFFAGTSGWSYNHWRGLFYPADLPQREWFTHYSRHFPTVEINYTFYRLPAAKTFVRWRDQSPSGFTYALKAPRSITHLKKLRDCSDLLEVFLERARLLGDKLGPILYQLPPNWKCDASRLGDFLGIVPEDLVQVFEFRDQSWYCDRVLGLLAESNVGFCYSSLPGLACPLVSTGRILYARMHGIGVKYGGCYTRGQLKDLAGRLQNFVNLGYDVFVYFNNDAQAYAVENAYDLRLLVADKRGE
jgi:uncharacterized protein YecE (DUF72 family)